MKKQGKESSPPQSRFILIYLIGFSVVLLVYLWDSGAFRKEENTIPGNDTTWGADSTGLDTMPLADSIVVE